MLSSLLVLALLTNGVETPIPADLRVVDDLGQEVRAPIRVCLYSGLLTECLDRPPFRIPPNLAGFTSVTAEGPGHGPVASERIRLEWDLFGVYLLRIPRKAGIVLRSSPGPPAAISLYPVDDPSFRKPAFRFSGVGSGEILVPAGEFLVAIADGTHAPVMSVSTLEPGSRSSLTYKRLPGWSALVRCQSSTAPLAGCIARALSATSPSAQREIARASSDRHGLVTLSGLTEPFLTLGLSASGFVPQDVRGMAAGTGHFVFQTATLMRGGSVRARVTLDEEPVRRARCQLLDVRANDVGPPTEETLYDGNTTTDGVCETSRVAEGSYVLRLRPAETGHAADEAVALTEGTTSEIEIRLRSLKVTGKVYRGTRPERGAVVRIVRGEDRERRSSTYLETTSDEEGEYRGTVWSTGEYSFVVMNAARSAVATVRRATVGDDGAEVDLYLNPYEISGRVQDDEQRPIGKATVLLTRNEHSYRSTSTASDGTFAFPMDGDGTIRLTTQKRGYQPREPVEFMLARDVEPAPVILTMKKLPTVKGTVLWPSGTPASNEGVGSFQLMTAQPPIPLGAERTGVAGDFEVPRSPAGTTQLFVFGQGCPLLVSSAPPEMDDVILRCSSQLAGMQLVLRDPSGASRPHESLILRWEGVLIPRSILRDHLLTLGLPTETDGAGRIVLAGLPVGSYDVFLGRGASEATIATGRPDGHLTSVQLGPFDRPEIEVTIQ